MGIAIYNARHIQHSRRQIMTRLIKLLAVPAIEFALLAGCEHMPWSKDKNDSKKMANEGEKKVAVAEIAPAKAAATQPSWGKPAGAITFTQMDDKVHVTGEVTGLPPGKHGI